MVESAEAPLGGVVLTAARSNEFAGPLPGASRPAFSYLVLAGMRGWADLDEDGVVTAQEVRDYVDETLRAFLRGERSQTPTLTGRVDMALAPRSEAAPDMRPSSDPVLWEPPGDVDSGLRMIKDLKRILLSYAVSLDGAHRRWSYCSWSAASEYDRKVACVSEPA